MVGGRFNSLILILFVFAFVALKFQNCTGGSELIFSNKRESLSSSMSQGGGGSYNGKPEDGYYCRIFDNLNCQAQVDKLQSLVKVDSSGIHLTQDSCASTSTNFQFADAAVEFTSLASDYIGVTRGIFKKCEVDSNNLPLPATDMTDVFCTSNDDKVAVILNKNILSHSYDFILKVRDGPGVRSAIGRNIVRVGNSYISNTQEFNLNIDSSNSQTSPGNLQAVLDQKSLNLKLDCRQASPEPTVIIERDMELSSTWIDTTPLAGYWKLNEVGASEGSAIIDSTSFGAHGILRTGNDGQIKSNNGAIALDGVDDVIVLPNSSTAHLDFAMSSFTYMAWIRKAGNAGAFDMPLWHGGNSANVSGYDIECGSGFNGCVAMISDGQSLPTSLAFARFANPSSSLIGGWFLLTAVVDRELRQLRTYLDGVLVSTTNISNVGPLAGSNVDFMIGGYFQPSYIFMGSVDDVSIWRGVLSTQEITEIFQRLRPKFY